MYLKLLYLELRSEGETEAKEAIPGPEEGFELILRKMENVSRGLQSDLLFKLSIWQTMQKLIKK